MKPVPVTTDLLTYRAPRIFVVLFYILLVIWTIFSIVFLGMKGWMNWIQILIVGFIFVITWYFSVNISYRIDLGGDGNIQLTSFRTILQTHPRKIEMIEGPHLPIGFVRFKLEREKVYLFCISGSRALKRILSEIRSWNPDIRVRNI